jgi:hypothetical protein
MGVYFGFFELHYKIRAYRMRIPRQSCHLIHGKVATLIQELATLDNQGYVAPFFTMKEGGDNAREEVVHA